MNFLSADMPESSSWSKVWSRADAVGGVFIGCFIAIFISSGATFLLAATLREHSWHFAAAILFFVWCLTTELWYLFAAWKAISKNLMPYPVAIALQQPKSPMLLRPFVALWWGYQSLIAMFAGIGVGLADRQMPIIVAFLVAMIAIAFSHATFGYFLLSVTAFTKEPRSLARVWSWRDRWAITNGIFVIVAHLLL